MELSDYVEYWTGLTQADLYKLFNTREQNRYITMLVKDKVFDLFKYVDIHTGEISHIVDIRGV